MPSRGACVQPQAAQVAGAASGNIGTFTWSGGGNNGQPVKYYVVCIDGACSNQSAAGSITNTYACGETSHSIYACVVDNAGQQSANSQVVGSTFTTARCTATTTKPLPSGATSTMAWRSTYSTSVTFTRCEFTPGYYSWTDYFRDGTIGGPDTYEVGNSAEHLDNGKTSCDRYKNQTLYLTVSNGATSNILTVP